MKTRTKQQKRTAVLSSLLPKNFQLILTLVFALSASVLFAQNVTITDDDTYTADASAMLDVKSTTKGLLVPRLTASQKSQISSPATGLLIYQTDGTAGFYYNVGTPASPNWIQLSSTLINQLQDADQDTKVQVEESADEDKIRFDVGSSEAMVITNDGRVGLGTSSPSADLHISGTEGLIVTGSYGTGNNLAVSGPGTRMIWYPKKAAFRAGRADGSYWDYANIGNYSVAFGSTTKASGTASTAFGYGTTASSTTSTAFGFYSGASGQYSTAIGYYAVAKAYREISMGSYPNYDGIWYAPTSWNSSDRLFVLGNGEDDSHKSNAIVVLKNGNTAIGYNSPTHRLEVNGELKIGDYVLPSTDGSSGQVLQTDGNGNLSWQNGSTVGSIDDLSDGRTLGGSVFLGDNAGIIDDGTNNWNTGVGSYALSNTTTGYNNTATGYRSLSLNTSGFENTASGNFSLNSNTIGDNNTALGDSALYSNVANSRSTAIGNCAMRYADNQSSGHVTYNTAVGAYALRGSTTPADNTGQYNVAVGDRALMNNTSGYSNTAVGYKTLRENTEGYRNTAIGLRALESVSTGCKNTAIGHYAGQAVTTYENTTSLGYYAGPTGDNMVRIGNSSVTSIGGYAAWSNLSDGRFKKEVTEDVVGLDFVMKLHPVNYKLDVDKLNTFLNIPEQDKNTDSRNMIRTGFIAQEVEKAARESGFDFSGVEKPQNENSHYSLRYAEFVVPLVKAMQEQQKMIDEMKAEIEELKALVTQMANTQN